MDNLNLPKTQNRILTENYLNEVDSLLDKIINLKENLPAEIVNKAITLLKQDIINTKSELIDISNGHKQELEKLSIKTTQSIIKEIKGELQNNITIISSSINNNFIYLIIFGLFCGSIGGLIIYLAKIFIL